MPLECLHLDAPGVIRAAPIEEDMRPGPGEALISVKRVSLCGSDFRLFNGQYGGPAAYPVRFGHEWSGVVLETGPNVSGVAAGDRVTGDCSKWCGACGYCDVDRNLCEHIEKFGITRDGFSAQRVLAPAMYLYAAGETPFDILALAEMFAVARHAIRRLLRAGAGENGPALVLGAGPLGIACCALMKREFGWGPVDAWDPVPERLAQLRSIEPGCAALPAPPEPRPTGTSYAGLYGGSRYAGVIAATAAPGALGMAVAAARPLGAVVCLGMPKAAAINVSTVVLKSLTVAGSIGGTGDFPEVLRYLARDGAAARRLITSVFPYREAPAAFAEGQRSDRSLKVQLDFDAA